MVRSQGGLIRQLIYESDDRNSLDSDAGLLSLITHHSSSSHIRQLIYESDDWNQNSLDSDGDLSTSLLTVGRNNRIALKTVLSGAFLLE